MHCLRLRIDTATRVEAHLKAVDVLLGFQFITGYRDFDNFVAGCEVQPCGLNIDATDNRGPWCSLQLLRAFQQCATHKLSSLFQCVLATFADDRLAPFAR